jgi:hypothetical protein
MTATHVSARRPGTVLCSKSTRRPAIHALWSTIIPKPDSSLIFHSIHNYKLISAVVPKDLLAPFTSINGDIGAFKKKAARLIRGEKLPEDNDPAQPTESDLPFDRASTMSRAVADKNTVFKGTLSSQSKSELMRMASVLGLRTPEKERRQELALKIREHLEANPDVRNNVQFTKLTWRSGNRKAANTIAPSPPETSHQASHQPLHRLPHAPVPQFPSASSHLSTDSQMALASHLAPSTLPLDAHQRLMLSYPHLMTPWYRLPSSQIPPIDGLHPTLPGYASAPHNS